MVTILAKLDDNDNNNFISANQTCVNKNMIQTN